MARITPAPRKSMHQSTDLCGWDAIKSLRITLFSRLIWGYQLIFPDAGQKSISQHKAIGNPYLINKNYQIYQSIGLAYDSVLSTDIQPPKE